MPQAKQAHGVMETITMTDSLAQAPATRWDRLVAVLEEVEPERVIDASHIIERERKHNVCDVELLYVLALRYQEKCSAVLAEVLSLYVLMDSWMTWFMQTVRNLQARQELCGGTERPDGCERSGWRGTGSQRDAGRTRGSSRARHGTRLALKPDTVDASERCTDKPPTGWSSAVQFGSRANMGPTSSECRPTNLAEFDVSAAWDGTLDFLRDGRLLCAVVEAALRYTAIPAELYMPPSPTIRPPTCGEKSTAYTVSELGGESKSLEARCQRAAPDQWVGVGQRKSRGGADSNDSSISTHSVSAADSGSVAEEGMRYDKGRARRLQCESPPLNLIETRHESVRAVQACAERLSRLCERCLGWSVIRHRGERFFELGDGSRLLMPRNQEDVHLLHRLHWLALALWRAVGKEDLVPAPPRVSFVLHEAEFRLEPDAQAENGEIGVQIATEYSCLPFNSLLHVTLAEQNVMCVSHPVVHQKPLRFACMLVRDRTFVYDVKTRLFVPLWNVLCQLLREWERIEWYFEMAPEEGRIEANVLYDGLSHAARATRQDPVVSHLNTRGPGLSAWSLSTSFAGHHRPGGGSHPRLNTSSGAFELTVRSDGFVGLGDGVTGTCLQDKGDKIDADDALPRSQLRGFVTRGGACDSHGGVDAPRSPPRRRDTIPTTPGTPRPPLLPETGRCPCCTECPNVAVDDEPGRGPHRPTVEHLPQSSPQLPAKATSGTPHCTCTAAMARPGVLRLPSAMPRSPLDVSLVSHGANAEHAEGVNDTEDGEADVAAPDATQMAAPHDVTVPVSATEDNDVARRTVVNFSATIIHESRERGIAVKEHRFRVSGRPIGKGAFGAVYRALDLETGLIVAVKQSRYSFDHDRVNFSWREFKTWSALPSHPNVITFHGASQEVETHQLLLVLEYASGGSIRTLYHNYGPIPEHIFHRHAREVACGLQHLHDHNVLHGDVKPENVLCRSDGSVAISDFGCSQLLICSNFHGEARGRREHAGGDGAVGQCANGDVRDDEGQAGVVRPTRADEDESEKREHALGAGNPLQLFGTVAYMAPEVILHTAVLKSDVWAYACTLMQLWLDESPWSGHGHDSLDPRDTIPLMYYIATEDVIPYTTEQIHKAPRWLQKIAYRAFERDVENRCNVAEILSILTEYNM